jgi:hypothetical protein
MLCTPPSMVGAVTGKLGPAWDDMGFDPFRSRCQRATPETNPSNCQEEKGFRLTSCHSAKSHNTSTSLHHHMPALFV